MNEYYLVEVERRGRYVIVKCVPGDRPEKGINNATGRKAGPYGTYEEAAEKGWREVRGEEEK